MNKLILRLFITLPPFWHYDPTPGENRVNALIAYLKAKGMWFT